MTVWLWLGCIAAMVFVVAVFWQTADPVDKVPYKEYITNTTVTMP